MTGAAIWEGVQFTMLWSRTADAAKSPELIEVKPRRDAKATKERILKTAERLFSERGLRGVSIGEISLEAQVNRRMVYVYFNDKDGLYAEVMNRVFDEIWRPVLVELNNQPKTVPAVDRYARTAVTYFDSMLGNPRYVRLLAWETATGWETLNRIEPLILTEVVSRELELLTEGQRDGSIRADFEPIQLQMLLGPLPFFYFLWIPRQALFLKDRNNVGAQESPCELIEAIIRRTLEAPSMPRHQEADSKDHRSGEEQEQLIF